MYNAIDSADLRRAFLVSPRIRAGVSREKEYTCCVFYPLTSKGLIKATSVFTVVARIATPSYYAVDDRFSFVSVYEL